MEFWAYYRILRRRRWLLAATLLTVIAVMIAADRPGEGDLEATATLSMPSVQRFFFVAGAGAPGDTGPNTRTTLALSLIRSWDVAERVVQRLNLSIRPDQLQRRLSVEKDRFADLIRVTMTGMTPGEAVTLANAVAEASASYDQELQRREVTLAREFLEKQAGEAQAKVGAAEQALLAFQQQNAVELATSDSLRVANSETDMQRIDLSLQEVEARLASVRDQMRGQSTTRSDQVITESPVAQQLRSQLAGLEVALTSELALHTEKHLSVVSLRKRIQAIKDRLDTEQGKVVASEQVRYNPLYDVLNQARINLETEKLALLARKEALSRTNAAGERALPGATQKRIEQSRLTADVEMLRRQYETIQTQLAATRLRELVAQNLGSLTVVNPARSAKPSLFGKRFRLTLAAVLGVLGGAGLAFFLEYLDVAVKIPENAERLLGVPALVAIPQHNPPFDEAYRLLRVSLEAHENGKGGKTIVVTAPKPGEGTSTVVSNLARAFARAGRRTIVVDAALRRPTQHVHFGIANEKGLAQILRGESVLQNVLAKTGVPNLSVLPSGGILRETDDLLGSGVMAGVLAELQQRGEVILIDTSAAAAFTDAFLIAPLASGVLLVLDARQAPRGAAEQVKNQLTRLGAKVLGVVVTKVRPDLADSYMSQEHFYKKPKRWVPSRASAVAAGALILVGVAGVITGISVKAAQDDTLQQTVAQWISALSMPWLSGH